MSDVLAHTFPYSSRRVPVLARNVVATSQPLAAAAGIDILRSGGNAIDAAIATAITLTVVEPTSNGIGSDAFAIVWDGERFHGLNASGRSPAAWSFDRFRERDLMPDLGWDSVTVPGAVDAWRKLSERFGQLPFERLFQDAIHYARHGFAVSPITAHAWSRAPRRYENCPDFATSFLPEGRAPLAGELFRFPSQADTLEEIAATNGSSFYEGRIASLIADHARHQGGALTLDDLANHDSDWVDALDVGFGNVKLHELPPNGQGIAALVAIGVLDHVDLPDEPDTAHAVHLQVEAMKLGWSVAHRVVSDPASVPSEVDELLSENMLRDWASSIRPDRATIVAPSLPTERGTVYLTTADEAGQMVSFIQSNFWGFGSGVVVPGTGISLQNRGFGFSTTPGHPNQVEGSKRPFHTIIPAFLSRAGRAELAFGVMGGEMQPQGHVQMVLRCERYGQNVQAALDAPRWFVEPSGQVYSESGLGESVRSELAGLGHPVELDDFQRFGGGQIIRRTPSGYEAASDPRKDGIAVGFG